MPGKILIVEDEACLRILLQQVLQIEGHHVSVAVNGEEALQYLAQEVFDLVITDIMMGKVSGLDVLDYIRTHAPETLVIVMTGYATKESADEAQRKGAYGYIAKPFEIPTLIASITKALEEIALQRISLCG
jgi:DNA-binding NtrC family response regulator